MLSPRGDAARRFARSRRRPPIVGRVPRGPFETKLTLVLAQWRVRERQARMPSIHRAFWRRYPERTLAVLFLLCS